MGKVIAVFNQKGGVGKTTTNVNLTASLGAMGKKILVLDLEPQGNTTSGFGLSKTDIEKTVYEVMEYLNVTKEECIYVGDSDVDMKTAQNAGVKSIGVAWGFRGEEELKSAGADYIIRTPQELVSLL